MPTRNVVITSRQEELIAELVTSGRYKNASEVLREGLRLIERRETADDARMAGLRSAIDAAENAIAAGELEPYTTELLDELDREEKLAYVDLQS